MREGRLLSQGSDDAEEPVDRRGRGGEGHLPDRRHRPAGGRDHRAWHDDGHQHHHRA